MAEEDYRLIRSRHENLKASIRQLVLLQVYKNTDYNTPQ